MSNTTQTVREALADDAERAAMLGSWVWDPATNAVIWSNNLFRLLGYEPGSVQPSMELFWAAVHPDDLEEMEASVRRAAAANEDVAPYEYRLVGPFGVRYALARGVAVRDDDGAVLRLVGTVQDVTHARENENALAVHAHVLEEAQAIAHVGSFVWQPVSGKITWSPELYRISGLPPDQTPTVDSFDKIVHPDDLPKMQQDRARSLETGALVPSAVRIVRPDNTVRDVEIHARMLHDSDSRIVGIVHDVTEQRALERKLRASQTMEAIGRLASGVAHDFNNLLTVITISAQMAKSKGRSEEIDDIANAAAIAAELTQRLLSLGRASQAQLVPLDVDTVVSQGRHVLLRAIGNANINLTVDATSGRSIAGDQRQLDQALLNLVINARDAILGAGTIAIRVFSDDDRVAIDITDDGKGMTDDVRAKMLDPFFSTKPDGVGTGLGLAMVQGAVSNMNGELTVETKVGVGTTVTLWFPTIDAEHAPKVLAEESSAGSLRGRRALVIDDEPAVRNVTARMLRHAGMLVEIADRPGSAATFLDQPLDIVVSDVSMPDGGGKAVADAFGAARPEVPLIFMTGYAEHGDWLDGFPLVAKPFLPGDLLRLIAVAISESARDVA